MKRMIKSLLYGCLLGWGLQAQAQVTAEQLTQDLVQLGFENVRCVETADAWVVQVESREYKVQRTGVRAAVDALLAHGLTDTKTCKLVVTDRMVPQLTVTGPKGSTQSADWQVEYGTDASYEQLAGVPQANSTLFKTDLVVYPQLSLKNNVFSHVYLSLFEIGPSLEVQLWRGAKLSAQLVFPIWNDGYEGHQETIRPGYVTLEQRIKLPYNMQSQLRLGNFDQMTYGVEYEVMLPLRDKHWTLNAYAACIDVGYFYGFENFYHEGRPRMLWGVGPDYYWDKYNTQFKLRAERYLRGDIGVKADMLCHFKYLTVGLYAEVGNTTSFNGGFRFMAALPTFKTKRKGYVPRLTTGYMGLNFNPSPVNRRIYYKTPSWAARDNVLTNNEFNAYFIQSGLK